jgi:hypothetical protein
MPLQGPALAAHNIAKSYLIVKQRCGILKGETFTYKLYCGEEGSAGQGVKCWGFYMKRMGVGGVFHLPLPRWTRKKYTQDFDTLRTNLLGLDSNRDLDSFKIELMFMAISMSE